MSKRRLGKKSWEAFGAAVSAGSSGYASVLAFGEGHELHAYLALVAAVLAAILALLLAFEALKGPGGS